ncbi:MAG: T9SS type A sorting domain-containing protein [Saprospiraceae bacterium]|nr:T9SS type A sorting domain-containing protein [Saprospiraceae bacterium]
MGSPCDTVHVANKEITTDYFDIKLFPNPASTDIKIDITLKEYDPAIKTEVVIIDISGAIVQKYTMPDFVYLATIDISKLARGVYGVQLRQPKRFGERVLAVEKLVVIR